jgi:hypothetical protein
MLANNSNSRVIWLEFTEAIHFIVTFMDTCNPILELQ